MNPNDLYVFMKSTQVTAPLTNVGILDRDWCPYDLNETRPHLYAVYDGYNEIPKVEVQQWVYIDTSNPELYVVYVCVSGG